MTAHRQAEALKAKGDEYFKSRDYRRALAEYREAARLAADVPVHWSDVAACLEKLGNFDEMEATARRCLEADETFAEGHFRLAAALKARNDWRGCVEALEAGRRAETETFLARQVEFRDKVTATVLEHQAKIGLLERDNAEKAERTGIPKERIAAKICNMKYEFAMMEQKITHLKAMNGNIKLSLRDTCDLCGETSCMSDFSKGLIREQN